MKFMTPVSLFLLAVICLCTASTAVQAESATGARFPALNPDGSQLAFSWRGDIWIVDSQGGEARRITDNIAHDKMPKWSPDGREIAFSSDRNGNYDIYIVSATGGAPERMTFHSRDDFALCWGPDGSIYFNSRREARMDLVYRVARSGGRPEVVIGDRAFNATVSPDGKWIAYVRGYTNWWRKNYRGWASRDIWVRALSGGTSWHITTWQGKDDNPQWSGDGKTLLFESERKDGVANLWSVDLKFSGDRVEPDGTPDQITRIKGDDIQFMTASRDGRLATFESEGKLWTVATAGGRPREVKIDCIADLKENPFEHSVHSSGATEFAFAPGEAQVAFIVEGEVYAATIKDDEMQDAVRITTTDAREKDIVWLDEEVLLYISDRHGQDDIFLARSTDTKGAELGKSRYREEERLTDTRENEYSPQVSPDGEKVLYRRANGQIWCMRPDGDDQKRLGKALGALHVDWAPDSRYIAYSFSNHGSAEDIFIYDTEEKGEPVNISNHPNDDFHPLWSGDGQRLAWASRNDDGEYRIRYFWLTHEEADKTQAERDREEEESDEPAEETEGEEGDGEEADDEAVEVKIDWDDIPNRIHTVTMVDGGYWDYDQSPDGKHYALRTDVLENMDLWTVDWDGDNLIRITQGGANPDRMLWSEDSGKIRYLSRGQIREIDNSSGASPNTFGFSVELTVNAEARRLQKFNEAWRLLNDGFYDSEFHGADWDDIRKRYEPLAKVAIMPEDFKDIIREMIGELNASHLGCYGGPGNTGGDDRTGLLGFYPDDDYDGKGVKVGWVLPRGPLDREGKSVVAGEIILAVNGHEIGRNENHYPLLNHQAGEEVDLTIRDLDDEERTITIVPVTSVYWLNYRNWVDDNRTMANRLSHDRVAYIHMSAMGSFDWDKFQADIFSRTHNKDALILDVRFNNGGRIHDQVLTFLSRRVYGYTTNRSREEGTFDAQDRWDKPIVVLINERSYSDGEIFPWGFKALGLGKLIGMPTFGAVIGTSDTELIDGTGFRVPGSGWYRAMPDGSIGVNLENNPVMPDVMVPDVPEENLQGRDAQIERAVTELLDMLD
ncbi:MAG: hypothetical protein GY835_26280 [bacterium]|nr:hypothetical protein [bacterium]